LSRRAYLNRHIVSCDRVAQRRGPPLPLPSSAIQADRRHVNAFATMLEEEECRF